MNNKAMDFVKACFTSGDCSINHKFFNFIKPYLSLLDGGGFYRNPFGLLYIIIALLNLLFPAYMIYEAIDNKVFDKATYYQSAGTFKIIITFFLVFIIVSIISWMSFQLWWDRRNKVINTSVEGDQFVAAPVFLHFIQTTGEWIGTWMLVGGTGIAIITSIFMKDGAAFRLVMGSGIPFPAIGFKAIVMMPVTGFLTIVSFRFLSELMKTFFMIANNTKKSEKSSPLNLDKN